MGSEGEPCEQGGLYRSSFSRLLEGTLHVGNLQVAMGVRNEEEQRPNPFLTG